MRETWTDGRMDDLNAKVDRGFERVESELRAQRLEHRTELAELRAEMNARFERVDERFERLDARLDSLNRTLIAGAISLLVVFLGAQLSPF